ncbi:GNAT family N-acetyltransferase [uncultured Nevskia sp.]|uniref:GNAT family N-acetyltransferase n=1 Tax=uncultured Nevskia sp. TaxID=228950 RepID=UPI0025FA5929|nr:GNAT family N-acetyltransferase [uncultured Nevskia sp.]
MLTISAATTDDVPTILHLIRALAEYEKLSHEVVATEDSLRAALFGERPGAECLIAREHGEPVGFALYFHNFSTFLGRRGLNLEDLFVEPAHRGKAYGKALLQQLAQIAVERGCGRLEWSVLDWNAPAIGFYESLGAKLMSEWRIFRLTGEALQTFAADKR